MAKAYCEKCNKVREMLETEKVRLATKAPRYVIRGKCSICKNTLYRLLPLKKKK